MAGGGIPKQKREGIGFELYTLLKLTCFLLGYSSPGHECCFINFYLFKLFIQLPPIYPPSSYVYMNVLYSK